MAPSSDAGRDAHRGAGGDWAGLPFWGSVPVAVLAGLTLTAAFPPAGIWPLAMVGPAIFVIAIWGRGYRATLLLGVLCGAAFYVPMLAWLVNIAWYAWIALAVAESLIFGVLALLLRPLLRLRAWPLAVAGWWTTQEAVHDRWPWGGFPWGRLAMSQPNGPAAGWSAIVGLPALSFLLALVGGCLAYLAVTVLSRPDRRRRLGAAAAAALATALALSGDLAWQWTPGPGPTAIVATIQGNVPHTRSLPNLLRATTVTQNHADATFALAARVHAGRVPAPGVVIWPENSTDIDPRYSPITYQTIAAAVAAINRPVLVGAVLQDPIRNAGQLWLPGRGPTQVYIKRRLVPFGEYIPMRGLLEDFTALPKLQPHNFTPGHRAVVFRIGKIRLGDVICYEVGFDNLVRSEVTAGANLLAVQTNDAGYELDWQTGETLQQLAMSRMDAISTGRAVAVASTTGISAIIDPNGRVLVHSRIWQRAELEARVPLVAALTPADRVGDLPEQVLVAATLLALLWSVAAGWRARRFRRA
ncbi:MAG: apolipoprotein N-acyltransferase [Streptosporangiaceae bacterium]